MSAGWFIVVAAMWGATNPFIKKGSSGIENVREDGKVWQFLMELKFLITNWKVNVKAFYSFVYSTFINYTLVVLHEKIKLEC